MKRFIFNADSDSNLGLLLLRIFTGVGMMTHGYGKLFNNLEGFSDFVAEIGFPFPLFFGFMAGFTEFFGALFLTAGFMTRVFASLLAITMFVAAFIALAGDPFSSRELALFYMVASIFFISKGGGKYSMDFLIRKFR
ncbi:MAG: DoxX family protein [bacterium]